MCFPVLVFCLIFAIFVKCWTIWPLISKLKTCRHTVWNITRGPNQKLCVCKVSWATEAGNLWFNLQRCTVLYSFILCCFLWSILILLVNTNYSYQVKVVVEKVQYFCLEWTGEQSSIKSFKIVLQSSTVGLQYFPAQCASKWIWTKRIREMLFVGQAPPNLNKSRIWDKEQRQWMCDSRRLGVYCSSPLAVIDDEAPRYHRCAIHFYRHRNSQMIWRNKGM